MSQFIKKHIYLLFRFYSLLQIIYGENKKLGFDVFGEEI